MLAKFFPFSEEKLQTAFAVVPLIDHDPLAAGGRFNGVDLDRGLSDRQRNTVDVSHPARIVRENGEVHLFTSVIKFRLLEIHSAPPSQF
jgi:hypothetical protein